MFFEIIGWVGTLAILFAYSLVSFHKISSSSKEYQLLNLFGAIGIVVNSAIHGALPLVGLNIAWFLIALFALYKIARK
ncbi:hypothetical protein HYV31_03525 [candidate division WWE3 bacterium]|nr:hypothetical protein [candidate division WWE3 bacterium]